MCIAGKYIALVAHTSLAATAMVASSCEFRCFELQVWFTNWLTTYGEAVVRVPQRAFTWAQQGLIGRDVTFVVRATRPSMASHSPCPAGAGHMRKPCMP